MKTEVSMVCDDCGKIVSIEVLPYYGASMSEYQRALHSTECDKCGGVMRPLTKDGIQCPNSLYRVQAVRNLEDNLVCEFTMWSTYNGYMMYGSYINAEEAADIVQIVENDDFEDLYFSYKEACQRMIEIEKEIEIEAE